mgnify:CR=1 FL=1
MSGQKVLAVETGVHSSKGFYNLNCSPFNLVHMSEPDEAGELPAVDDLSSRIIDGTAHLVLAPTAGADTAGGATALGPPFSAS